jgi:cystathionine beta-lyase/cystathionine gamma-synthase
VKSIRGGTLPDTLKSGHLVRFSIGLEAVEDLQADLVQAMQAAFN